MFEFTCTAEGCSEPVRFSLPEVEKEPFLRCPACGKDYTFPPELLEKFKLLKQLIAAIKKARPILGRTSVVINVNDQEVKIPYYLLLSRMTTELALDFSGSGLDFRFFIDTAENHNGLLT